MEWQGSVPGKTFLFGEYLVLAGGPAVVLGTKPCFELKAFSGTGLSPFRAGSPAQNLFDSQRECLAEYRFEFINPYAAGGFGASGAEFVLLARFLEEKLGLTFLPRPEASIPLAARVLDCYYSFEKASVRSSGSDVLTQWLESSILYQPRKLLRQFRWPFAGLDFSIFSTGVKVVTHDHLANLKPETIPGLTAAGHALLSSLETSEADFVIGMRAWSELLAKKGFTADESIAHARAFEKNGGLFARGCGAMGADTILVLHRAEAREGVRGFGAARGLRFQAGREHLTEGIQP